MSEEPDTARATLLVVDDDPAARAMIGDVLGPAGYHAAFAESGEAALAMLDAAHPDLILLDAMMPGMDGFATCRRIKATERWRGVPVVFMTGLTDTAHVVAGLAAGGVDYVTKPVVIAELLARIEVHLANGRLTRTAQGALDASGRALFALDPAGRLLWATPTARRSLPSLPGEWLRRLRDVAHGTRMMLGDIEVERVAAPGSPDLLFRIGARGDIGDAARLRAAFALTPREGDVLRWVARGKANRDVSTILNISPRTVDKHLEQIFQKMGVENRSTATALAVAALARD